MAELPTGTVTLLFTDIEGSTRLWEEHPTAMRAALARHDALMRACCAGHQGHVFKTVGDAFCVAFPTAPDAIAAALEAQRALQREPWPEGARLKVRMALHSGGAEVRDGDYFGPALNRVARLLATAHGGQTVLSEAAVHLCRDHLPPLATLKALGAHGLKDLERSEAVYQACHPDLPATFPPLRAQSTPAASDVPSIAVLPFVNMSRDEENEYFADGLSEELLNVLAKIRGLKVASRTSAFSFKGDKVDIATVARKLGVANVLEGSVRKAGLRVRITAQLIAADSDSHLWSETYDRQLDDIFAVQDDIAQSVVEELRAALFGEGEAKGADGQAGREVKADATTVGPEVAADATTAVREATVGRSDNPEAYRLYLEAKFFGERITQADTDRAIALYRQALSLDPGFALAWAGLSNVHVMQGNYEFAPRVECYASAREAAQQALQLAPDLAEAHVALSWVRLNQDWDWAGAEAAIRRALELAPGSADALRKAAAIARVLGRLDEAAVLNRRSLDLDPLSYRTRGEAGIIAMHRLRLDEAESHFRRALELYPGTVVVHAVLAITLLLQGKPAEALASARQEPIPGQRHYTVGMASHTLGDAAASDAALQTLERELARSDTYQIAALHAWRGEVDAAFDWLERAYAQRDNGAMYVAIDPEVRALHGDPRWRPFLRRMGLEEAFDAAQRARA